MFELSTLIIVGLACLVVGGFIGAAILRNVSPQENLNRQLEARLQEAEEKLKDYQSEVTEHFAETSRLVNKLTQDYKEVHQFLASSALKLTTPDISRQLIEAADGKLLSDKDAASGDNMPEPPRDWAPKTPGAKGQLSESYGLEPEETPDIPVRP